MHSLSLSLSLSLSMFFYHLYSRKQFSQQSDGLQFPLGYQEPPLLHLDLHLILLFFLQSLPLQRLQSSLLLPGLSATFSLLNLLYTFPFFLPLLFFLFSSAKIKTVSMFVVICNYIYCYMLCQLLVLKTVLVKCEFFKICVI